MWLMAIRKRTISSFHKINWVLIAHLWLTREVFLHVNSHHLKSRITEMEKGLKKEDIFYFKNR